MLYTKWAASYITVSLHTADNGACLQITSGTFTEALVVTLKPRWEKRTKRCHSSVTASYLRLQPLVNSQHSSWSTSSPVHENEAI